MNEVLKENNQIFEDIKQIMLAARENVVYQVNTELLNAYWQIGRIIVEHEQDSIKSIQLNRQCLLN